MVPTNEPTGWQGLLAIASLLLAMCGLLYNQTLVAGEALHQQTFELTPGWNAIYLEVEPDPKDIESAMAGIPVESVWRWIPRDVEQAEFIQDPAEGLLNINGWHGYFPFPRPEAFLSDLFTFRANQAYLIKLAGSQPVTWTVNGRPQVRRTVWRSDSFNLSGFAVDPLMPPTFGDWFERSSAHNGQPVYRLNSNGVWELIELPYATLINSGEAYWVYTDGASTYQGPMAVTLEYGDSMEYSAALTEQRIIVENNVDITTGITISRVPGAPTTLPMAFEIVDPETDEFAWPDLPDSVSYTTEADDEAIVNLSLKRAEFNEERMEQLLEISNGLGSRVLVHVGGNTIQPPVLPVRYSNGRAPAGLSPYAGLWKGFAAVDGVSEAQLGGTTPQPTGRSFPLRFLLHVDNAGQVRLLKDVIEMWEEGTYKPSATDPTKLEVDVPGHYVLVTNEDLLPDFTGVQNRDGTPVGLRHSTVAYDFEGEYMEFLPPTFDVPTTLSVTLRLDPEFPTNPFKHRYHPDHDNLDRQFLNFSEEAFEVTRNMEFEFTLNDPSGSNPPDWGDSILGGFYRETITGLHRNAIFAEGEFRLKRISAVPVLNQ